MKLPHVSRHDWWRALTLASLLLVCSVSRAAERTEIDLSGAGWHLSLDTAAKWRSDTLFFPAPRPEELPVNPPTGGWVALAKAPSVPVSVPGTVEQYLQRKTGPDGDIVGVSWWYRTIDLPASAAGRRVLLRFESIRQRAEVFVNRRLAAYDVVGNSPLEIDLSDFVRPGTPSEIAVRVTDPAGNFDWRDSAAMRWGRYMLPMSHGFGGITGRVRLVVCDPVFVADVYVQNTPAITTANAIVTVRNTTPSAVVRDVAVRVVTRDAAAEEVLSVSSKGVTLPPGDTELTLRIDAPAARVWDTEHPNLYVCEARLLSGDAVTDTDRRTFGFRWFEVAGLGENAIFRLNGRRIVLRTAISWGFWPVNGIFPTEELALKQVRTAKELGLNMLTFHRAIGNPIVLEKADELGLLYFEEPGAHKSVSRDPFGHSLAREKLLRMVRRDRSHPSLIIYNLINEWDSRNPNPDPVEIARHRDDMQAAHAIDPSRIILHTSAWSRGKDIDDPAKMHFRPFDAKPYMNGWYDVHHAGGPAVWNETMYRNPGDFYGLTDNTREIVFWGEEGAISTPPRIEKIHEALQASPQPGWDGGLYEEWYAAFSDFLDRKNLRSAFPTVDAFTTTMGNISLRHQGRRIENMRMSDITDGYSVNGWESEIVENHSGIVDCFRNPKGDPAILRYYNQPLYVAVKVRTTVLQAPGEVIADFFAINERNLRGPHTLRATLRDASGGDLAHVDVPVNLSGGETYGQLLATGIKFPVGATALGALKLEGVLLDPAGVERARGADDLWTLDWKSGPVAGNGAVWEADARVSRFLTSGTGATAPGYREDMPAVDWIVTTNPPVADEPVSVAAADLRAANGVQGLQATFFADQAFKTVVHRRIDPGVAYAVEDGAAPEAGLAVMNDYGIRWEGTIVPPRPGVYTFAVRTSGAVTLTVGGKTVLSASAAKALQTVRGTVDLGGGVPLVLEFRQGRGNARCELGWLPPPIAPTLVRSVLERVRRDGTTLVILEHADLWMPLISEATGGAVRYRGSFKVGRTWLGGVHFARAHPLLSGLPVDQSMDWPYQNVVRNGDERLGLDMDGEELVAGCYHSYPMQLGTVLGVIPLGRGRIVFTTLDIAANLNSDEGPAQVARKLLSNFLSRRTPMGENHR